MDSQSAFRTLTAGVRFNKRKLASQNAQCQPRQSTSRETLDDAPRAHAANTNIDGANNAGKPAANCTVALSLLNAVMRDDDDSSPAVRKALRIRCAGDDLPDLWTSFASFPNLPDEALENLALMSILQPTPIQMQAPPILYAGRDLLACAPTGSGKTLAFLLPLFLLALASEQNRSETADGPLALVIEPTRELARQVYTEAGKLRRGTGWRVSLLGEDDDNEDDDDDSAEGTSQKSPHLLVTTPLKLVYAIKAKQVNLEHIRNLVLDEADRLFELGFLAQTDEIMAACTSTLLRKAMFSATIPSDVEELAKSVLSTDFIRIIIGGSDSGNRSITQELMFAGTEDGKLIALKNLIKSGGLTPPALIFVQSIDRARDLNKELLAYNVKSDVMHSERSKEERDKIVKLFAAAKIWVLVCTDVMSRGVDFRGVQLVINYDFPQSVQSYIHRIGRTGRAGRSGRAVTLFTKADSIYLRSVINVMRNSGCEVPPWMLSLPAPSQNDKKRLRKRPVERKDVSRSKGSIGGGSGSRKKALSGKKQKPNFRSKPSADATRLSEPEESASDVDESD